jgi:hypothetical protein
LVGEPLISNAFARKELLENQEKIKALEQIKVESEVEDGEQD